MAGHEDRFGLTTTLVVFGRPGREVMTAETIERLHDHGGAATLRNKELFWTGMTPPPRLPPGWDQLWFKRPPAGSLRDFWTMLTIARDGSDLIVCEDDIAPCRNAARYIERWTPDYFTSFCNVRGRPLGPQEIGPSGFSMTQTIKIPARLVARLRDERPEAYGYRDPDITMGAILKSWGELVYYHRSIVQHVGTSSARGHRGRPVARDFVGVDFDALAATDGKGGP